MALNTVLEEFHQIAANPRAQMDRYIAEGMPVVGVAPVYTPEEIIHAMGMVPMGTWGGDCEIREAKQYFPAFICSVMQTLLELGISGAFKGMSAIVIPSLCDSLRPMGENWKYAVPDIPFVPMTYPQNRKIPAGRDFVLAGYRRVIADLERITGKTFSEENLAMSISTYNRHNALMRQVSDAIAETGHITAAQRSDIFKSALFLRKEEHSALLVNLLEELNALGGQGEDKAVRVVTTGILADSPHLLELFDERGIRIVADDVAAESRQYRTDTPDTEGPLTALAQKFCDMGNCSVLHDPERNRPRMLVETVREKGADGIVVLMTKFCDPEEFDYVYIKNACAEAGIPMATIEVDRQMQNFGQAATVLDTFTDMVRQ